MNFEGAQARLQQQPLSRPGQPSLFNRTVRDWFILMEVPKT